MATKGLFGLYFFGTFMYNRILGIFPKFQGKNKFLFKSYE